MSNAPVDEAQLKQSNEKQIDDFAVNSFMKGVGFLWDDERQWWYNEDGVHMYQRAAANMFNKISVHQARESHKGTGEGETPFDDSFYSKLGEVLTKLENSVESSTVARMNGKTVNNRMFHSDTITRLYDLIEAEHLQDREQYLAQREEAHLSIYMWLLGLSGQFPVARQGAVYSWRSGLREKLPKDLLHEINKRAATKEKL